MRRLSVVIPSYNHARFVADAIRSVAAQDRSDLDLVVVDDGSSDGSPDVIRRTLAEVRLPQATFLEHANRGAHTTIARGVEATCGELVTILNSDDRYHPERFARMARSFPERGDFLAFSMVRMIGPEGEALPGDSPPALGYRHALYEASRCPTVGFGLLRNNFAVSSGNLVFTRTLYDKIGGFSDFALAHDWDFLLQALVHVEPIFVPEPLLDYRTHGFNQRLQITGEAVNEEGRAILRRYLDRCDEATPANTLAPCEAHWPVYFDLFLSRYHAWFAQGALREWIEQRPEPPHRDAWRSWSEVIEGDRVDDCDYLVDPSVDPAHRTALALVREVLISAAHPLADEEGTGPDALREAYARHSRKLPRMQLAPWKSPIDRTLATLPPVGLLGWLQRRSMAGLQRVARRVARRVASGARLVRGRRVILDSGIFDATYYVEQAARHGLRVIDPIAHYLWSGAALGLDPHPLFETRFYEQHNQDVRGRMNPLVHYLLHGDAEGRKPGPSFDPAWYRTVNPDVARSGMNTLSHWCRHGEGEGRWGHPRFDAEYYVEQLAGERPTGNLWAHYLRSGIGRGLGLNRRDTLRLHFQAAEQDPERSALVDRARDAHLARRLLLNDLFDPDTYRYWWGRPLDDVSDLTRHFLTRGAVDGVPFCPEDRIEKRLHELENELDSEVRSEFAYLRCAAASARAVGSHRVSLFVSSKGNAFFREMAEILARGFEAAGAATEILDETTNALPGDDPRHHSIVIAPHEFFVLGDGARRATRAFLGRSSLWLAEQPGTEFFAMGLWFARYARRVLDINPLTALLWGTLGFESRALPLGFVEGIEEFADALEIESEDVRSGLLPEARRPISIHAPLADRPIDVFFNGVLTERRERFFARNAFLFSDLRCALFMPSPHVPVSKSLPGALSAHDATALAQRARIQLNLHRGGMPYFEWHRLVVRGIWQKALVVSDPSFRVPGFQPGEHYVECETNEMPRRIEWLLRTEAGRRSAEEMRNRAFEVLRERFSIAGMAAAFLEEDTGSGAVVR
jgi:glycosyltransferase involved in cell wall biosynthesis